MRLSALSILAPFALCFLLPTAPVQARDSRRVARKAVVKVPPPAPDVVQAPAWVLIDPSTGRVLESKNPHQRMFPASTTKTMTALLAIESGKLDQVSVIGSNPPTTGEQSINLLQGEQFTLRDLVRAALIKSANDSCVAIAEAVAGDVPTFVKMMNAKAKELGAKDTHFCNPHGLHDPNHYSTAYDLALIAQAAMRYPEFNEITRTKQTEIHGNWKIGPIRPLVNRNRLLMRWNQCDGVKTGYTRQAGRCLIASATQIDARTKESWRLLSVVLKSPDSWHDSQALLQYHGFAHFKTFLAAHSGEEIGAASVKNGSQVQAVLPQDAVLTLRNGEENNLTRDVQWNELEAPLKAGQVVGHLDYFANGQKVAALPVVAQNEVPFSRMAALMPTNIRVASPFKTNYLSLLKLPMMPNLMASGLLLLGVMLLWGGLKGGRKQANEKRKQPARRAAPNQSPDPKNSHYSNRRNPDAADTSRRETSASNQQPQRAAQRQTRQQPTQQRDAQQRPAQQQRPAEQRDANQQRPAQQRPAQQRDTHTRAARQAQQFRHSAPGSIHQERQHGRREAKPENLGEQFIARFLEDENDKDINAESEIAETKPSRW